MTATPQVLPQPESTYQLLLDAARAWPEGIATQWIPDPAAYTDCLTWTYTDLAGTVTRIANGLASLGVRRPDAVTLCGPNTSQLFAATLAAQAAGIAAPVNPALSDERIAELIRRTGSRILVAAGPELDPQLWQRLAGRGPRGQDERHPRGAARRRIRPSARPGHRGRCARRLPG